MIKRLQIGTSRLEALEETALAVFLNKSWIHLGDAKRKKTETPSYTAAYIFKIYKEHGLFHLVQKALDKVRGAKSKATLSEDQVNKLYTMTNFQEFYYQKGDTLPFDDGSIEYIYSEHFLEHIFFDEASSLFSECKRILTKGGVIRTCVPDADLRVYEAPEPVSYPHIEIPFSDPFKHKERWSVYSLGELLTLKGFESVPIRYCDKKGAYIQKSISEIMELYKGCPDQEIIMNFDYVMRKNSLIIDGIKRTD